MPTNSTRAAEKYGIPIDATLGDVIALHFTDKREAIMRYRS